jgi:hypothetical protein
MSALCKVALSSLLALASVPSSAATIINAVADPGSALVSISVVAGDDFTNNGPYSSNNTAYIADEGKYGFLQTFLLHYDKSHNGIYSGVVSGSFDILLAANDIYLGVLTDVNGLLATDPANGAIYQTAPGHATIFRGFEADDYVTVTPVGNIISVKYHLVNGNPFALDDARFGVASLDVPEPASWAMMIGGFGLMGAALRYRRGKQAVKFA